VGNHELLDRLGHFRSVLGLADPRAQVYKAQQRAQAEASKSKLARTHLGIGGARWAGRGAGAAGGVGPEVPGGGRARGGEDEWQHASVNVQRFGTAATSHGYSSGEEVGVRRRVADFGEGSVSLPQVHAAVRSPVRKPHSLQAGWGTGLREGAQTAMGRFVAEPSEASLHFKSLEKSQRLLARLSSS